MQKLLLIDGNNMLFKAYHATLYGRMMTTSNGVPTNAIYGFALMIQKAMDMIQPDYVLVAWDTGKPTFRHLQYEGYKGTRKDVDEALIVQFPIAREYLDACGIPRFECDGIEADDIIGTMARNHPDYQINILSSDKDLWQLIDPTTNVYVMRKGLSEIEVMDEASLMASKGIVPSQIIDLKALMGDASDNIPGVKGIGEKTALKLLADYETVDNVYAHIDELKGKLKEKLENDKDNAFMSKELATIKVDCALPFDINTLAFVGFKESSEAFYRKYEMASFIKQKEQTHVVKQCEQAIVTTVSKDMYQDNNVLWVDVDNEHYIHAQVYGIALHNGEKMEYIRIEDAYQDSDLLTYLQSDNAKVCYDAKNYYHALHKVEIASSDIAFDVMIAAFLSDGMVSDYDQLVEAYQLDTTLRKDDVYGKRGKPKLADEEERIRYVMTQLNGIASIIPKLKDSLQDMELQDLFEQIEMPLTKVLFNMEKNGVCTDSHVLDQIAQQTAKKIDTISNEIFTNIGHEFNINSPKQLATVLFDELGLKAGKKRSTAADVLEKLVHVHPIIPLLLEQRKCSKLYSTYAIGLGKHIHSDGKIHTIFNQTQTQTGRLSSSEPNLQNISVRDEDGKEIRRAFVASPQHTLLGADYSQIELRLLAHMADEHEMINAFQHNIDIHTKTAMQIFDVAQEEVDTTMRRNAKTVNFGIVYGQSDFGLSEQLAISRKEAHEFIEKYFASYPNIKAFMDKTIAFCEEHGYVKTLFNRRRYIKEINDKNYMMREFGKRAAMNAPIQGSAADLIKVAMIKIDKVMQAKQVKSQMILQIHDELIFDVVDEELELMKEIVESGMQQAMELKVPLLAEANSGKNWYDTK